MIFKRRQRAGALLQFIVAATQQPRGHVKFVGVEVAANGDARVGFGVEKRLDEKPRLERLTFALLRGDELAFRLRLARPFAPRRGDRGGTGSP